MKSFLLLTLILLFVGCSTSTYFVDSYPDDIYYVRNITSDPIIILDGDYWNNSYNTIYFNNIFHNPWRRPYYRPRYHAPYNIYHYNWNHYPKTPFKKDPPKPTVNKPREPVGSHIKPPVRRATENSAPTQGTIKRSYTKPETPKGVNNYTPRRVSPPTNTKSRSEPAPVNQPSRRND